MTDVGACVLPRGHNMGRVDVPGNHSAGPGERERVLRVLNDSGSFESMEAVADAVLSAATPSVERLAEAVLAARSETPRWKGLARAKEPTPWDKTMARRIIVALEKSSAPLPPAAAREGDGRAG